jgi:hypothetical protein
MTKMGSDSTAMVNVLRLRKAIEILIDFYNADWKSQYPTLAATLALTFTYALFMDLGLGRAHQNVSYECVGVVLFLLVSLPIITHALYAVRGKHMTSETYVYISAGGENFLEAETVHNFIRREINSLEAFDKGYSLVPVKGFIFHDSDIPSINERETLN